MLTIKKLYLWSLIALLSLNLTTQSAEHEDYVELPLPQTDDAAKMADQAEPAVVPQQDEQQLLRNAFKTLAQTQQQPNGPDLSIFKAITRILDQQKVTNITVEQDRSGVVITLHTAPSNIQIDLNEQQTQALRNAVDQLLQPTTPQTLPTRQPMAPQPNQPAIPQNAPAIDPNNGPTPPNGPNGPEDPKKKPDDKLTKEEQEKAEKEEKEKKDDKNPLLYDPRLLEQNKDKKIDPKKADQKKDDPFSNNQYHGQQNPGYQNYHPMQNYYQPPHMQQQQPKAVGGSTTDKTAFVTQTSKPQTKPATFEERQALVADGTGKIIQTENRVPEPSNQPRRPIVATPEPLEHTKVTDRTSSLKVVLAGPEEPVKVEQPKPQPELTFFEKVSQKITNFFLSCWQFIVNLLPFGK